MNTQNDLSQAQGTLDHTRKAAAQAMERVGDKARDFGFGVRDVASRGAHSVTEGAHAAQRHISQYAAVGGRYVTDHPLKSALIAAGIGALVAGAIIALRRHRD
jgi:ElaB/YqjD/DUF883 family membrane-anchored ribosome-binding protein